MPESMSGISLPLVAVDQPKSAAWKHRAELYAASSWQNLEDGMRFALARGPIDQVDAASDLLRVLGIRATKQVNSGEEK